MIIIPAIDIKDGAVVRLLHGNFDKVTVYSEDPVGMAEKFTLSGAKLIHVVDLDGAKTGELKNLELLKKIISSTNVPIEFGGGIRDKAAIKNLLNLGVHRVILTTRVVEDEDFLKQIIKTFGHHIVISIDAKDGYLAMRGWKEVSKVKALDFGKKISNLGVKTIIYTDVATDGALTGPNIKSLKEMLSYISSETNLVASGGVSGLNDLKNLISINDKRLEGAIVGRAIYENKIDLKEAINLC